MKDKTKMKNAQQLGIDVHNLVEQMVVGVVDLCFRCRMAGRVSAVSAPEYACPTCDDPSPCPSYKRTDPRNRSC